MKRKVMGRVSIKIIQMMKEDFNAFARPDSPTMQIIQTVNQEVLILEINI